MVEQSCTRRRADLGAGRILQMIAVAAQLAEVSLADFKALNPAAKKSMIVASGTPRILLPWDNADVFSRNLAKHQGRLATYTAWVVPKTMRLGEAADRSGMEEGTLRALNNIPQFLKLSTAHRARALALHTTAGEPVAPGAYYFRESMTFEAPPGPHAWLNGVVAIGTGGKNIKAADAHKHIFGYATGLDMWRDGDARFKKNSVSDGLIEVLGTYGAVHMARMQLGVPFSDPMADGPVIQKASERALARGIGMTQVLDAVSAFRQRDERTPVVLMGYANPVERYDLKHGADAFVRDAAAAGVDGVLIVDYPPEECEDFSARLKAQGLDLIFLLAPTSTDARMALVGRLASGYVYYVSLKGVTGAGHLDTNAVEGMLPLIRSHVPIPVGVGFGIRDAQSAQAVGRTADAVVIGSKLIETIEHLPRDQVCAAAEGFLKPIRAALDALPRQAA